MKKVLMTLAVLFATIASSYANVADLILDQGQEIPGLTLLNGEGAAPSFTKDQCSYNLAFTMDGVNVALTNDVVMYDGNQEIDVASTGNGMAYVKNCRTLSAIHSGIYMSGGVNTQLTVKVPGAKITKVKLVMSGYSVATLTVMCPAGNDKDDSQDADGELNGHQDGSVYYWTYSNAAATSDEVQLKWIQFPASSGSARYIRSIEVTYTPDLGDKQECGLSFASASATGFMGEAFSGPAFSNPNNLPVTWTSSNKEVATVDANGKVTLVGPGRANITASTEGNDSFAPGFVRYTVDVTAVANNIPQMLALAGATGDRVKVNFPMTVNFGNLSSAWVTDPEGNAATIWNTKNDGQTSASTIYTKVGEIIPAGWVATNNLNQGVWKGLPASSSETVDVVYPMVESINFATDAYRVVVLKNVDLKSATDPNIQVYGTTKAGTTYPIQDTFGKYVPAGYWDLTVVVQSVGGRQWLAPIKYTEAEVEAPASSALEVALSGEGSIAFDEDMEGFVGKTTVIGDNAELTITIPLGWDNIMYLEQSAAMGSNGIATQADDDWTDVSALEEAGWKKGNVIVIPAGETKMYQAILVKGNKAYNAAGYAFYITVEKKQNAILEKFTFDFTGTNPYGYTANKTFTSGQFIAEVDGMILSKGKVTGSVSYSKTSKALVVQSGGAVTLSTAIGNIQKVEFTLKSGSGAPDKLAVVIDGKTATLTSSAYMMVETLYVECEGDGKQVIANDALSFSESAITITKGLDEVKSQTVNNPENLPIVYSSDSDVILVNAQTGEISLAEGAIRGVAEITATFPGNEVYREKSVSYTYTLNASANSLEELLKTTRGNSETCYINFPLQVVGGIGTGYYTFVESLDGKYSTLLYQYNTGYVVGDVIPAGWTASVSLGSSVVRYTIKSDKQTALKDQNPTPVFRKVTTVTRDDASQVVMLQNVEFTAATLATASTFKGTADGVEYTFNNQFKVASVPAGTYDVKCGVYANNSTGFQLYPIEFVAPEPEPVAPAASELKAEFAGEGKVAYDAEGESIVGTTTTTEDAAAFTITIPEGWDNFVYKDYSGATGNEVATQADEDWVSVSSLTEAGWTLGNVINVPADDKNHTYMAMLVKGEQANQAAAYRFDLTVTKEVTYPIEKSVTFDFTGEEPYGFTANTNLTNNAVIATEDVITLKAGSTGNRYVLNTGIEVNSRSGILTIVSDGAPISKVTYTTTSSETNPLVVSKVSDSQWTISNIDMDKYTITTITVDYVDDGKVNADIAFPAATLQIINGMDEFKGLVLTNPHEVPVTYTSSNADILVNENGEVSMAEGAYAGTATITATFEGNDAYRPATASYTLTVVTAANSLAELKTIASKAGEKAYVNFPVVVAYSNSSVNPGLMFIQSLDGKESSLIYQSSIGATYKPNDIIPAGWTASVTISQTMLRYSMSTKPASTETQEPVINEVTELTTADYGQIVVLKNVEIDEEQLAKMPDAKTGSFTPTVNGVAYDFNNMYKVAKVENAGKYDVKCGVVLYDGALRVYPLEYTEVIEKPEPTMIYDLMFGSVANEGNKYYPSNSAYNANFTYTLNSQETFTISNFNNNNNNWSDMIKCGRKNTGSTGMITTDFKVKDEITSIVLGISKINETGKVNGFTVETSTDNATWTVAAEAAEANYDADAKTVTLAIAEPATNLYYRVSIDCQGGSANGIVWLTDVKYYGIKVESNKKEAELSFPEASYTVGEGDLFNKGILSNPNELPVTWTSSDETVATVTEEGYILIKGVGTTTITATSAETDEFEAGEASYKLTVVPAATTVPAMLEKAPNLGDEILMNGALDVMYANGNYVYVQDLYENATLLYGANNFKTGDVIPGGWVAKNAVYNGLQEWTVVGEYPASTVNWPVVYPEVETVSAADVNKVVVIKNVTVSAATPADRSNFNITIDGAEIQGRNQFEIASVEAGKYNLTAAVATYNGTLQLYPIEFTEASTEPELVYPDKLDITFNAEANVTVEQGPDVFGGLEINITGSVAADNLIATIAVPEGWDNFLITNDDPDASVSDGSVSPLRRANMAYWVPVDQVLPYGYALGNVVTVNPNNVKCQLTVLLVKDNQVDNGNPISLNIKVSKENVDGVEAIEAVEDGARYFTLDGVEVVNPVKGIYVKVLDGKATKVVIR